MDTVTVRTFGSNDLDAIRHLVFEAIRRGTAEHYDPEQRAAWAPVILGADYWQDRLAGQTVLVAEGNRGVAGFMALRDDGYLDLAFVAPESARQGIGSHLLIAIEAQARLQHFNRLHTDASHLAYGMFVKQNWVMLTEQEVTVRGVSMTNFSMEKILAGA